MRQSPGWSCRAPSRRRAAPARRRRGAACPRAGRAGADAAARRSSRCPRATSARNVARASSRERCRWCRSSQGPKWRETRKSAAHRRGGILHGRRAVQRSSPGRASHRLPETAAATPARSQLSTRRRGPGQRRMRRVAPIEKHLHPAAAGIGGFAEGPGAAPAQGGDDAFDMLAGAEAIDPMIDAAAGIGEILEAADLALRRIPPVPERIRNVPKIGCSGSSASMRDDLGAAAPAAQRDLVLVGGQPAERRRRPIEDSAGAPARAPSVRDFGLGRSLATMAGESRSMCELYGPSSARSIKRPALSEAIHRKRIGLPHEHQ